MTRQRGFVAATEAAQRDLQKRIRTTVPGTVVGYEPTTRRAAIQPAPSLITHGREGRVLPPIPNVPVMFPGGGGFELVWPLASNDRVTLVVFDRSIDRWLRGEPTYVPNSARMHNLSDVMVLPQAPSADVDPNPGETADFVLRGPLMNALRVGPEGDVQIAEGTEPAARVGDEVAIGGDLSSWLGQVASYVNGLAPGTLPAVPTTAGLIASGSERVTIG